MKFFDFFASIIDDFLPFILLFLLLSFFGYYVYSVDISNSPATDLELLDAKSQCPTISNYLPDSITTSSSLEFYVQKCKDSEIISKQREILK